MLPFTAGEQRLITSLLAAATTLLYEHQAPDRAGPDDLTWVFPLTFLPDASQLLGLPVLHFDVPAPLLSHWIKV